MRKIYAVILILISTFVILQVSKADFQDENSKNLSKNAILIGDFLKKEVFALPGKQAKEARDIWVNAGVKKIEISEPKQDTTSKNFIQNIIITDASEANNRFMKVILECENDYISAINIQTNLANGDFYSDMFADLKGQYEPIPSSRRGVVSAGVYLFDDYYIRIIEKSNETKEIYISKNPEYRN